MMYLTFHTAEEENQMLSKNKHYQLSFSSIDLFLQCTRCFYNHLRLGIKRPGPDAESFKLPKIVEERIRKEFDLFRGWKPHPTIMADHQIDAIPLDHKLLSVWRNSNYGKGGIRFYDIKLNLTLLGVVDDIWESLEGELIICEYKTTSTFPGEAIQKNWWYESFKRQVSFYAWLFKMNGYKVYHIGYFVYCNGLKDGTTFLPFDKRLEFEVTPSAYTIDDSWIESTLSAIKECLVSEIIPEPLISCKYCKYANAIKKHVQLQPSIDIKL